MKQYLKLIILGPGGVGKSSITIQFLQNHFIECYDPTIEDSYRKQVIVDNKCYFLEIVDTAGQEEYSAMSSLYLKDGDGFIIVYDVTKIITFSQVEEFRERVSMAKQMSENIPIILCGNKSDFINKRQVTFEHGSLLAEKLKCKFIECSAKTGQNIDELWFTLIREIENKTTSNETLKKKSKYTCMII